MSRLHCRDEQRHNSVDVAQFSVERQLSDDDVLFVRLVLELTRCGHNAECDGKIEHRTFFFRIGRRKIDDNALCRILKSAVFDCRTDAFLAFLRRSRGKSDHIVAWQTAVDVHFDVHGVSRESVQGVTEYLCEHNTLPYIFISLLILS